MAVYGWYRFVQSVVYVLLRFFPVRSGEVESRTCDSNKLNTSSEVLELNIKEGQKRKRICGNFLCFEN